MHGLERVVAEALKHVEVTPADKAATELALVYAKEIDLGLDIPKLGPALLACLAALGMTPAARNALVKGGSGEPAPSPLDELRDRRAARTG